jgi:hypothetical protein
MRRSVRGAAAGAATAAALAAVSLGGRAAAAVAAARGAPPDEHVAAAAVAARHRTVAARPPAPRRPDSSAAVATGAAAAHALPFSTLSVWDGGEWRAWWRADQAPARWDAPVPAVAGAIRWHSARPGLEWGELRLAGSGEAWRIRAVVVRADPRQLRFAIHAAVDAAGRAGPWTVDRAPANAALAVNAGQFTSAGAPWGWVVHQGREIRPPGYGPLAPAVVVDSTGAVRLVPFDSIAAVRGSRTAVEAFQSYPALLEGDGAIPAAIADTGHGVDLAHRDSRLVIGEMRDGRVLLLITRFEALGGALDALPFGLTVPETAALVGALGARRAVALDGGLSGQLLLRDVDGTPHAWRGLRRVALGLVALPAPDGP